jgi:hypothetical protein
MADQINWGAGSGAADALNEILTQRKLEARQAFLDQLNAQNVQSEMEYRHQNALSLAEQREAHAQLMRQQAGENLIKNFGMGQNVTDDTYNQAKKLGVESSFSAPQASMGPDFQGPMPEGQTPDATPAKFIGSPQDQRNAEILKRQRALLDGPLGKDLPPAVRMQMEFDAASGKPMAIPAGDWATAAAGKHSPEWIEYQDYAQDVIKSGGKPIPFTQYMNEDANRKRPAAPNIQFLPNFSGDPNAPLGYNRNPKTGALEPVVVPPAPSKPLQQVGQGGWGPVVNGKAVTPDSFNEAASTQGNVPQPKVQLTRPPAGANAGKPATVKVNNATWNNYYMLHQKLSGMTPNPKDPSYVKAKTDNDMAAARLVNEWQGADADVKAEVLRAYQTRPDLTSEDILKAAGDPNSKQAHDAAEMWQTLTGK